MHNVLADPMVRTRLTTGVTGRLTLPDILAAMMRDEVAAFPALRPHQRHAWHAFLAQIGVIALDRAGTTEPPEDAETWRRLLQGLTPGFAEDQPWHLVVDDLGAPSLLQPPVPERSLDRWKPIGTPDQLDLLITAKNFDIKQAVALTCDPEDWLFALVDLQTMEGFLGAGNYGIARMNGGFSARPCLGYAPARGGPGAHLRRDIVAMLATRERLLEQGFGYRHRDGLALLWLAPWDGKEALGLDGLDPYFVEICRRIRLRVGAKGDLFALGTTSDGTRLAAKDNAGVLGDFWTPVNVKDGKALSLTGAGFDARVMTRILFGGDFRLPTALTLRPAERSRNGDWLVIGRGMARGQGKTEGWHEVAIPFRHSVALALGDAEGRNRLGDIARLQLEEAAHIARALRRAIGVVAQGGGEPSARAEAPAAAPFLSRLQAEVDARFFAALQDRFAADAALAGAARIGFVRPLLECARALLAEATETVPCRAIQRDRARVRADRTFQRIVRSHAKNPLRSEPDAIALIYPTELADADAESRPA